MLYIIGLGLADERDISVKGLEIVRKADRVYLEAYTAILLVEKEQLVRRIPEFYGAMMLIVHKTVGGVLRPPSHPRRPGTGRIPE